MSSESRACILEFSDNFRAAISATEMKQLVVNPELSKMPIAPEYCRYVFPWYNQILPSMDITTILSNGAYQPSASKFLAVVCFRHPSSMAVNYGALLITGNPLITTVDDAQATELPKQPYTWKTLAHSCFTHQGEKVPILNLSLLFSDKFRQLAQAFLKHRAKRSNQ